MAPLDAGRRAGVRLRLARASIAARRWDEAIASVDAARCDAAEADRGDVAAEADALAALIALDRDEPAEAKALAERARDDALRHHRYEVACEALEVLGRCARTERPR